MSKRSASGLALATVVMLGGCAQVLGIEDLSPSFFTVRGMAAGVIDPVSVRLEHTGGSDILSVTEDGPFAFEAELDDGASYTVMLVGSSPCILSGSVDVVRGSDPEIELTCDGALRELAISGPAAPDIDFKPSQTSYEVDVSILQQSVRVAATAVDPAASITVAGIPVTSGVASEPVPLNLGENIIDVVIKPASGGARSYRVLVRRAVEVAQHTYIKASNTDSGDVFGWSVALWGDTLAVAAYEEDSSDANNQEDDAATDSGAVYVFRRDGAVWTQEAYLKASNLDAGDNFGYSVALWEDTLAVGAPGEDSSAAGVDGNQDDDTLAGSGAVYVFRRDGAVWTQEAYLKASNPGAVDNFGLSVALWGDTLIVGSPGEDSNATGVDGSQDDDTAPDSGAVYVFRRDDATWAQEAYIKASNTGAGDYFGWSVAVWEDTIAASAPLEDSSATGVDGNQGDDDVAVDSGAVYVFRRDGTIWAQEAYIKASNTGTLDAFGYSISLWGDTLAIGANTEDSSATGMGGNQGNDTATDSGAVYILGRDGSYWIQQAYLKASNTGAGDIFGRSVALWGDTLAVGAVQEDSSATGVGGDQSDNGASESGAVYLFRRDGVSWIQRAYLKASNAGENDRFGSGLALWEDTLVAGARYEASSATGIDGDQDDNSASESGAVYVFH